MDLWYIGASAVLGAVSGGIAAALAHAFVKDEDKRKTATTIAVIIGVVLSQALAMPIVRNWKIEREAETALQSVSLYRAIQQDDPAAYARLKTLIVEGLKQGKKQGELTAETAAMVTKVMPKYMRVTSDEAAIRFTRSTMVMLSKMPDDVCYAYLFPANANPQAKASTYISGSEGKEMIDSIGNVVETAIRHPNAPPSEADTQSSLLELVTKMKDAGESEDMALLTRPRLNPEEQGRACHATQTMYARILEMPDSQSGPLLRSMFSIDTR